MPVAPCRPRRPDTDGSEQRRPAHDRSPHAHCRLLVRSPPPTPLTRSAYPWAFRLGWLRNDTRESWPSRYDPGVNIGRTDAFRPRSAAATRRDAAGCAARRKRRNPRRRGPARRHVVALLWANSPWWTTYDAFWHTPAGVSVGDGDARPRPAALGQRRPDGDVLLRHRAGDQPRVRHGRADRPPPAPVPIAAALGGIAVPALLYLAAQPLGRGGARRGAW